jgi:hypothetical protein
MGKGKIKKIIETITLTHNQKQGKTKSVKYLTKR